MLKLPFRKREVFGFYFSNMLRHLVAIRVKLNFFRQKKRKNTSVRRLGRYQLNYSAKMPWHGHT